MKDMMRVLIRYVLSAAGIAVLLVAVNLVLLVTFFLSEAAAGQKSASVSQAAASLAPTGGGYAFSDETRAQLNESNQWAMLIGEDGGIRWGYRVPDDVPEHYSLSDVAAFTRWYLGDYPVRVWKHSDGLFVLASPKNSEWKGALEMPNAMAGKAVFLLPALLLLNGLAAVGLALLLGFRLIRSMRALAAGIAGLSAQEPVSLPEGGLLSGLAEDLNRASEALQSQKKELEKRDTARSNWIAGVSHDVRTPLSVVLGYASSLAEDETLPCQAREQSEIIRHQSLRIRRLVEDLNLASRLEYEMQPLRCVPVCPAALLRKTAAAFYNGGLAESFSISLSLPAFSNAWKISADEALLTRAVENLINNSIRHNPAGCAVTLSLAKTHSGILLTVEDNGTGAPEEVLHALNQDSLPDERPRGMGLVIARQVACAHGGSAVFSNPSGGGFRAELMLPVLDSALP